MIYKDSVFTTLSSTTFNKNYGIVTLTNLSDKGEVLKYMHFNKSPLHFSGWDMKRDYENNFVIVGSLDITADSTIPFILKMSANFDSLWIKYFDDPKVEIEEGFKVSITPDSGYVVMISKANFNKNQRTYLLKTDKNGNKLWDKQYNIGSEAFQTPQSIHAYKSGDIIFGWFNTLISNGLEYHQGKITKVDNKGIVKWTRTLDGDDDQIYSLLRVEGLEDEGCVTAWVDDSLDNMAISRYDKDGNKLWKTSFPAEYVMRYQFSAMALSHDGNILVSGYVRSKDFFQEVFVMKIETNTGKLLWRRIYSKDNNNTWIDYPRGIVSTPDGRIAIGSYREDITAANKNAKNWLLVMDSLGCSVPNCEDSLINVMKLGVGSQDLGTMRQIFFKVGPNPVADFVNCYFFDAFSTHQAQLAVYDATGRKLITNNLQSGEHFARLDLSPLAAGKYYICYSEKGRLKQSESVVIAKE